MLRALGEDGAVVCSSVDCVVADSLELSLRSVGAESSLDSDLEEPVFFFPKPKRLRFLPLTWSSDPDPSTARGVESPWLLESAMLIGRDGMTLLGGAILAQRLAVVGERRSGNEVR